MIDSAREAVMSGSRAHLLQAGTGSGKTRVIAEMAMRYAGNGKRSWIIAPRNNLVYQISESLAEIGLPHGMITANNHERPQYLCHVVSKDTIIRRYDKIKNWPDVIFFDEAHLYLDKQIEITEKAGLPQVFGASATPQRLDGRGLSRISGGLYDSISYAPSIAKMVAMGYLSPLRYMAIPLSGVESLHYKGQDVDANELDELLKKNHVYGNVIEHYQKYGEGRSALIFTRSVKASYELAEQFRARGYKFECIEGRMGKKQCKALLDGVKSGKITGLVSNEILTYGTDLPIVSYGASVRPTSSLALYYQMIGRILRLHPGKKDAIFCDHCGMITEHGIMTESGLTPPFYLDSVEWNFDGTQKRKRKIKDCLTCKYCDIIPGKPLKCLLFGKQVKSGITGTAEGCPKYVKCGAESLKICLNPDCSHVYEYYEGHECPWCGETRKRKAALIKEIDGDLVELAPVPLGELPPEERKETQDRITSAREGKDVKKNACNRRRTRISLAMGV